MSIELTQAACKATAVTSNPARVMVFVKGDQLVDPVLVSHQTPMQDDVDRHMWLKALVSTTGLLLPPPPPSPVHAPDAPQAPPPTTTSNPQATKLKGNVGEWRTSSEVQEIIHAIRKRMDECYRDGRKTDPHMEGRVQLTITVGANGKALGAKREHNGISDGVLSCITNFALSRPYPPTGGGKEILPIDATLNIRDGL